MSRQRKKMVKNYLKSYNDHDMAGMTKDLDRNVVFENISNGKVELRIRGLDEFKRHMNLDMQYTRRRERTVQSWIFDDSKVSIQIKYKAILAIDLMGSLEAGDTLKLEGKSEFVIDNGKIISITDKA